MKKKNTKRYHSYDLGSAIDTVSKIGMNKLTSNQQDVLGNILGATSAALPTISGGNTSIAGNFIGGIGDVAMAVNPIIGIALKGIGTLTNAAVGSNINESNVQAANSTINNIEKGILGASTYEQLASSMETPLDINNLDLGTQGWFSHAVDDQRTALQNRLNQAQANSSIAASNIDRAIGRQMMSNAFSNGGTIHIKPENRGKFTAAAKSRGMGVQEFASKVLANKDDYSPLMVKRANFARNAAHWNANGGMLFNDFTNGVTIVGNGGTHEENPNEGVQMGIAPDGKPNLVEEGEVIYNNYVFSNRLAVPKAIRQKHKLRGKTFAEAFKLAQKESEERPNDPISKTGLENMASILANAQEEVRAKNTSNEQTNKFEDGSFLPILTPDKLALNRKAAISDVYNFNEELQRQQEANALQKYLDDNLSAIDADIIPTVEENPTMNSSWLRYAEPAANLSAVTSDMMGITNKPYTYSYIHPYSPVRARTLGNYVNLTPFDTNWATNQVLANAAATRRAVANSASPAAAANILAADYNTGRQIGETLRQAQQINNELRLRAGEFNRGTDQFNAQTLLNADEINARNQLAYDQAALQQAKMNIDETNTSWGARAQNLGALATSTANIGRERDAINFAQALINSGVPVNDAYKQAYSRVGVNIGANGGKLKTKKKGLTY